MTSMSVNVDIKVIYETGRPEAGGGVFQLETLT